MTRPKLKLRQPKLLKADQSIRQLLEQRKLLAAWESSSACSQPTQPKI